MQRSDKVNDGTFTIGHHRDESLCTPMRFAHSCYPLSGGPYARKEGGLSHGSHADR